MRDGFIFDGRTSHDFSLIECRINDRGSIITSDISKTDFQTFTPANSDINFYVSSKYPSVLTKTITVCQTENCQIVEFSLEDIERIQRWFCRDNGYYPFGFIREDSETILYDAKIDIQRIEIQEKIIGLTFTITTNSPYGYTPRKVKKQLEANSSFVVADYSSKTGQIQPNLQIKCLASGNYSITTQHKSQKTNAMFLDCSRNEIITLTDRCVLTSSLDRDMSNKFNYEYPIIANSLDDNRNIITVNNPCELTIEYKQMRKVGL